MPAVSDESSVTNSRPLDVHRWSTYIEVERFVDPLWRDFSAAQPAVVEGSRGRPARTLKRDGMKVLLLDLYVCWCEDKTKYLGISSNVNNWSRGRYRALHLTKSILDVLRWLITNQYVDVREHWHSATNPRNNRTARYRASARLQRLFEFALFGLDDAYTHENKECIILKNNEVSDDETQESVVAIEYEDTPATIAMRQHLTAYNMQLKKSHIDICSLSIPLVRYPIKSGRQQGKFNTVAIGQHNKHVKRIFSRGSWEMHGRFYGGWWQQIGSDLRRHIYINGNPTVEVDFKAMHIALLNAQIGADVVYDPYKVDSALFPDVDRLTVRGWSKRLVLAAINAESRKSAFGAFRLNAQNGSVEKGMSNAQLDQLLDGFIARNPHLNEFMCSDHGIKLMYKDSLIAADIIDTLTVKNITVLTIHDSFIVERHHFSELRIAMASASLKHCKRNLIAEQDEFDVKYEDAISWGVINEKAVNRLPKYEPCEHYKDRFKRFCDMSGLMPSKTNRGRGLMARNVVSLG